MSFGILQESLEEGIVILRLQGRLDTIGSNKLENTISYFSENVKYLILDMESLDYLSSSGLRVLLQFYKFFKKRNGAFIITGLKGIPKRVIEVTELEDIFLICKDNEEALEKIKKIKKEEK